MVAMLQKAGGDHRDSPRKKDVDPLYVGELGRATILCQPSFVEVEGSRRRDDRDPETIMSDGGIGTVDPFLQRAIDAVALAGLQIGLRVIAPGDEFALLDEEKASMGFPAIDRCRASGAVRRVARELMVTIGHAGLPILKGTSGAPIWPAGIVGSMAHDDRVAVAAVGLRRDLEAIGIDIEPAVPLPPDVLEVVAMPQELCAIADDPLQGILLFAAKEAIYKATYPLDHEFLDFHDIEVDLAGRLAKTRTGRTLALHWCVFSHVLVVATVQKASMDHLPSR
jgi:4'-phosphopantetheinyl transferase EntD